jgi:hypothetical protein
MGGKDKKQETDEAAAITIDDYVKAFGRLSEKATRELIPFNPQRHKDETRAMIAKTFTCGFFIIIAIIIIGVPTYNISIQATQPDQMLNVKDMLITVSSVIGGPFGFVVGYYFKGSEEK